MNAESAKATQPQTSGTRFHFSLPYPKTIIPVQTRILCHMSGGQCMVLICVLDTGDPNPLHKSKQINVIDIQSHLYIHSLFPNLGYCSICSQVLDLYPNLTDLA
jgi:hypothetical protein